MRDPLVKAYGHVYPAGSPLEDALRAAPLNNVLDYSGH